MFSVYILECVDGSYYVVHAIALSLRMKAHEAGTAAVHTSERRPVRLVYAEDQLSREAAARRERQLKCWAHPKKKALIEGDIETLHVLNRCRKGAGRKSDKPLRLMLSLFRAIPRR